MMSPPRPPSPPSGPPMGTNFSRRKETIPDPPSPAFTLTTTRSMNMGSFASYARPQQLDRAGVLRPEEIGQRRDRRVDDVNGHADVQRTVQMGMQLSVLACRGARRDDAQLPASQVQSRAREYLAVALGNHPVVQPGVKLTNVVTQT